MGLAGALSQIVDEICDILNCDRASVFILDEMNRELWTKVAKGTKTIRIPMDKGIVGHAVTTRKLINIEDAYQTEMFNKEIDKKTNYKTKSILCIPMQDQFGNVIGACQAINKLTKPFFHPEDI